MSTSSPQQQAPTSSLFRLYIHTSTSFPWPATLPASKDASELWSQEARINSTLQRLPSAERTAVTRYFHASDASRCLSSFLLKHLAIMRGAGVSWSESITSQERDIRNGKPYFAPGGVAFNVSHHGEYVVCFGSTVSGVDVGVDVVQIGMERDLKMIEKDGFEAWVRIFSEVFSEMELGLAIRAERYQGTMAGLRQFYTVWACKEAYVKMTSDALMAEWLKDLSFPGLVVPQPAAAGGDVWGEKVTTDVMLHGKVVDGVKIELVSLGRDYIVASAIDRDIVLPDFELVEVSSDGSRIECSSRTTDKSQSLSYSLEN